MSQNKTKKKTQQPNPPVTRQQSRTQNNHVPPPPAPPVTRQQTREENSRKYQTRQQTRQTNPNLNPNPPLKKTKKTRKKRDYAQEEPDEPTTATGKKTNRKKLIMRKRYVIDDLGIAGGGMYCFLPFDRLDEDGKALFKIGYAVDFKDRLEHYHSYFPLGVFIISFLEKPTLKRTAIVRSGKKGRMTNDEYYHKVETFLKKAIKERGGEFLYSTTRIKYDGRTEWVYTDAETIYEAFTDTEQEFGGTTHFYNLDNINKNMDRKIKTNTRKQKKYYKAEIYYPHEG